MFTIDLQKFRLMNLHFPTTFVKTNFMSKSKEPYFFVWGGGWGVLLDLQKMLGKKPTIYPKCTKCWFDGDLQSHFPSKKTSKMPEKKIGPPKISRLGSQSLRLSSLAWVWKSISLPSWRSCLTAEQRELNPWTWHEPLNYDWFRFSESVSYSPDTEKHFIGFKKKIPLHSTFLTSWLKWKYSNIYQLVVSTHLKNISENWNLPQIGMKIKHIWNHHHLV